MVLSRLAQVLFVVIAIIALLIFTKAVLIPLALAVVIWFIIRLLRGHMERVKIGGKTLPLAVRSAVAFAVVGLLLFGTVHLLLRNFRQIGEALPGYEQNVQLVKGEIEAATALDLDDLVAEVELGSVLGTVVNSLTNLLRSGVLILIYVVFIMLEERHMRNKALALQPDDEGRTRNLAVLQRVDSSLSTYVTIKSFTSLLTGALSYVALRFLEVDFAFFWGFMIFVLNYIPTVGSLIATVFPTLLAAVQFGSFVPALWVLGIITGIQLLVGNVLEPRIVGNSLNMSPLVVVLSLTFWGGIWGIVGMLLSAPITVALVIVLAQFERTRWVAVLLSDKGKVGNGIRVPTTTQA